MKKEYVLFIDSGIGGLTTMASVISSIKINCIYFADTKNCPYGSHSKDEVFNYLKDIISSVSKKYYFKTVVIACNTATTSSIFYLRQHFTTLSIYGIEPAISLVKKLNYNSALCVATKLTLKQKRISKLINNNSNLKIKKYAPINLALSIENYLTNKCICDKINILKYCYIIKKRSKNYDCIILGCTHYIFIEKILSKIINKPFLNGNNGLARNLIKNLTHDSNIISKKINVKYIFSSNKKNQCEKYIKILNQILAK